MMDPASHCHFPTTCWSRVVAAADRASPGEREAPAALRADYWYPPYALARRKGSRPDEAEAYAARGRAIDATGNRPEWQASLASAFAALRGAEDLAGQGPTSPGSAVRGAPRVAAARGRYEPDAPASAPRGGSAIDPLAGASGSYRPSDREALYLNNRSISPD